MAYAAVAEPFRAANLLAGRPLDSWVNITVAKEQIMASSGTAIRADRAIADPVDYYTLLVIAGGAPTAFDDRKTIAWLDSLGGHRSGS